MGSLGCRGARPRCSPSPQLALTTAGRVGGLIAAEGTAGHRDGGVGPGRAGGHAGSPPSAGSQVPRPSPAALPTCPTAVAEAAESRWRLSTACKQNQTKSGERKGEYGAAENGASTSRTSFFPFLRGLSLGPFLFSSPLASPLFSFLLVFPTPTAPLLLLLMTSFSPLFLHFFPLSVPLSPFCVVTGSLLLSSLSGLAHPTRFTFL